MLLENISLSFNFMNKKTIFNKKLIEFQRTKSHGKSGVINRLFILKTFLESLNKKAYIDFELLDLIPVAIVSAYESFFKFVFANYIDNEEKYLNRSILLINAKGNLELDFDVLKGIKNNKISIGELISLSLKYSTSEIISNNISKLRSEKTSENFYSRLKRISSKDLYDQNKEVSEIKEFISYPDKHIAAFKTVFDLRHKYIHEFIGFDGLEYDEVIELLNLNINFMKAVERMVWEDLFSNMPITQTAMNQKAKKESDTLSEELNSIYSEYENKLQKKELKRFRKITKDWEKIIGTTSIFFADNYVVGGTMHPYVYFTNLKELKNYLKDFLNENNYILNK